MVRHRGSGKVVMSATPQLCDLARDVHDLAADARDLGLPAPLGLNVVRCQGRGKNVTRAAANILMDREGAVDAI